MNTEKIEEIEDITINDRYPGIEYDFVSHSALIALMNERVPKSFRGWRVKVIYEYDRARGFFMENDTTGQKSLNTIDGDVGWLGVLQDALYKITIWR